MYCKNFLKHIVSDESTLLLIISKVYDMSSFKIQLSVCCLWVSFIWFAPSELVLCLRMVFRIHEVMWTNAHARERIYSHPAIIYIFLFTSEYFLSNNNDNCESYKGMHDLRITSAWYKISFYSTCFWAYYDNKTL